MLDLYNEVSVKTSKIITRSYSTSFSKSIAFLKKDIRDAIFSIYGFVRLADEIVDTFHNFDKEGLINRFERNYYEALEEGISLNPVLNAFRLTVEKYNIDDDLVQAFLKSMKTDLVKSEHNSKAETDEYIYGSAEVVGLMCLKVFTGGDKDLFTELSMPAKKLGAAFQKVNFLRDIRNDTEDLNRQYFHNTIGKKFDESVKMEIIRDVEMDFSSSMSGLKRLPHNSRLGVLIAYYYYKKLLSIIRKTPAEKLLQKRIRVPDAVKMILLIKAYLINKLNLL